MSCTELGFSDDYGLRVAKSSDLEVTFRFPATFDFDGYTGELQIRDSEDSEPVRLALSETATLNGSVLVFSGRNIVCRFKREDLETLPENEADSDEPWVGFFDWVNTDTAGLTVRFKAGAVTAERGGVR